MAKKKNNIVDAELVEVPEALEVPEAVEAVETPEAVQANPVPIRMSKADMIANGLLPPKIVKTEDPLAEAVAEVARPASVMKEVPVDQMQAAMERAQPKLANQVPDQVLIDKASARGGMALELIKAILTSQSQKPLFDDVDEMIEYVFRVADGIQGEVDNGYNRALAANAAQRMGR